jgi:hypothetical protein
MRTPIDIHPFRINAMREALKPALRGHNFFPKGFLPHDKYIAATVNNGRLVMANIDPFMPMRRIGFETPLSILTRSNGIV